MVELLELAQAGLTVTAVAITVAVAPVAILTGEDSDGDDIIDFAGKVGLTYKF